jgi:alkylated DNA repair dioxygenase AlkB
MPVINRYIIHRLRHQRPPAARARFFAGQPPATLHLVPDLFPSDATFQRLPASDADLLYRSRLEIGAPTGVVLNELIEHTPWRAESVVVWGKRHLQPRLTAWYGDEDARYEYSGLELDPWPWTPRLLVIKASVERAAGSRFNSVLLNYYRNERDSMGMHSDDEPELGAEPVIASLSLGEARTLVFRHRSDRRRKSIRIELGDGCLLLMRGATQRNWKHGIAKERRPCGARVNLTFRRIVQHPALRQASHARPASAPR